MKILSVILATLILFLTVQPLLTKSNFITKKKEQAINKCCCNKQDTPSSKYKNQQETDNNCCDNGHCDNPFLTCANCYFINQDNQYCLVAYFFIQSKKTSVTNDKALSSYIHDFWHPPETV